MKKIIKTMLILLILGIILTACGGNKNGTGTSTSTSSNTSENSNGEIENLTIRASSGLSPTSTYQAFHEGFMEQITNETGGNVQFQTFYSGELVPLGSEYDALRQGTMDIALSFIAAYDPSRFPLTEVTTLPVLESNAVSATNAFIKMMNSDRVIDDGKTYYQLEFEDNDLVAFPNPLTAEYVIGTTKHEFNKMSDFDGSTRLRASSRVLEIFTGKLGLTPINIPSTDAYDALSRNALDGVLLHPGEWKSTGVDELLNYTIEGMSIGHFPGHVVMTKKTWDSFSKELQSIFLKVTGEQIHVGSESMINLKETALKEFGENGGEIQKFDDLDPAVKEHFEKAIVETWYTWIENLESNNLPGKEMALLWRDLLLEEGVTLPQEIMDIK